MKDILETVKTILKVPFYRNTAIAVSLMVAYLSYWLITQTTTIPIFIEMTKNGEFGRYSILYGITYGITTLLIVVLSGISVAAALWLYRHSQLGTRRSFGVNLAALGAAMFGTGCPVCGAFLFSAIGVASGLTLFPLQGLELKFLSLALLSVSTLYSVRKVKEMQFCTECNMLPVSALSKVHRNSQKSLHAGSSRRVTFPLEKVFVYGLVILFLSNQFLISNISASMGIVPRGTFVAHLFGSRATAAKTIIAPKINPDGKTTSLVEQPTITELPANPNTGDALADAKVILTPIGKPFYAPEDISFDDPINAQKKWGAYLQSIQLSGEQQKRWNSLINTFTCDYCCGGPSRVTAIARCGCAHSRAWQGFFKYMITTYGDQYSDDELMGEASRWKALWYPKGMLEDYLLATGKSEVLPHNTHGGAGSDGRHGL